MAIKASNKTAKAPKKNPDKAGEVDAYMQKLKHPLHKETEALRAIIKSTDKNLGEGIKWNAPSYHLNGTDLLTFGPLMRKKDEILIVFHHPEIVKIKSPLLQGEYKDRRLAYFRTMTEIQSNKKELQKIIKGLIKRIKQ